MNDSLQHSPECFASHMGVWCCEPMRFAQAVSAIKAGLWAPQAVASRQPPPEPRLYAMRGNIAVIPISGFMMRGESKYGGASTVAIRQAVRRASQDSGVKSILMPINSPGGSVWGTDELGQEVARANQIKPVFAHCESVMASAAYWVASQAGQISANPVSESGSIGTYAVLEDSSKAAELAGVKVHVVSSGKYKGMGVEGSEITDEQLAHMQGRIDELTGHFLSAIERGRGGVMNMAQIKAVADGRVWGAAEALQLGLIDRIQTLDETFSQIAELLEEPFAAARDKDARARLALAKVRA